MGVDDELKGRVRRLYAAIGEVATDDLAQFTPVTGQVVKSGTFTTFTYSLQSSEPERSFRPWKISNRGERHRFSD
jgi:hypothetical protein